jgi:hypothetical protein
VSTGIDIRDASCDHVDMNTKYAYRMPHGTIAVVNSRNLEWEMSDDYAFLAECEVTDKYRGQNNLRAVVNGLYVYDK